MNSNNSYELEKEKELVRQARSGDQVALGCLYDGLFADVYPYARLRLPTEVDAQDVVSDTFMAMVKGMADFEWRYVGSFRAWVFQIAHNQIADFYRKRYLNETSLDDIANLPDDHDAWQAQMELAEMLLAQIRRLPPRQQDVLLLRYYGGLRNNEIASALGLEERTISAHLSRALAFLQKTLFANHESGGISK
jgi:RNA polymerase sigma-70 factor, ECF subfamily